MLLITGEITVLDLPGGINLGRIRNGSSPTIIYEEVNIKIKEKLRTQGKVLSNELNKQR